MEGLKGNSPVLERTDLEPREGWRCQVGRATHFWGRMARGESLSVLCPPDP